MMTTEHIISQIHINESWYQDDIPEKDIKAGTPKTALSELERKLRVKPMVHILSAPFYKLRGKKLRTFQKMSSLMRIIPMSSLRKKTLKNTFKNMTNAPPFMATTPTKVQ